MQSVATKSRQTKKALAEADRLEAVAKLREMLPPGSTVYTILRHVSPPSMSRKMSLVVISGGKAEHITWLAARALGDKAVDYRGNWAIKVSGCGMDMGFHLVYSLSRRLYPQGFPVVGTGRNGDTSGHDQDGGYALNQRWL
jgi:hypothetical protein